MSDQLPEAREDGAEPYEAGSQRGVEVDATRYLEPGRLAIAVGADGLPVVAGEPPSAAEEGLSDDNLICLAAPGRPACEHYIALLRPADGVSKGFAKMRQIRRFCRKLATTTELFEVDGEIYACTGRSPRDEKSARLIEEFEGRQKEQARETAQTSGELDL